MCVCGRESYCNQIKLGTAEVEDPHIDGVCVCVCVCVLQAPSPVNPNALDRTAAWLLNMNVQYLDQEGAEGDFKGKEELTQTEKVLASAKP